MVIFNKFFTHTGLNKNRNTRKVIVQRYHVINQLLSRKCSCSDALSFFFGFNDLEVNIYFSLTQTNDKTIAEMCEVFNRNQSTIYTAVEKLVSHSLVIKRKRSREIRGYEYIYNAVNPSEVKTELKNRLDRLYTQLSSCLENFENDVLSCDITI